MLRRKTKSRQPKPGDLQLYQGGLQKSSKQKDIYEKLEALKTFPMRPEVWNPEEGIIYYKGEYREPDYIIGIGLYRDGKRDSLTFEFTPGTTTEVKNIGDKTQTLQVTYDINTGGYRFNLVSLEKLDDGQTLGASDLRAFFGFFPVENKMRLAEVARDVFSILLPKMTYAEPEGKQEKLVRQFNEHSETPAHEIFKKVIAELQDRFLRPKQTSTDGS